MAENNYAWEVLGSMREDSDGWQGYTPTIGFVWTETPDRGYANELAGMYYGNGNIFDIVESRFGANTPPTGFVPQ